MEFLMTVLEHFAKNSKIRVCVNEMDFVLEVGKDALISEGAYKHHKLVEKECLYIVPRSCTSRALLATFHEMAHATGKRLGRPLLWKTRSCKGYEFEEVVAETAALQLLQYYGLSTEEAETTAVWYIMRHSSKLTKAEKALANEKAAEAVDYILKYWLPDIAQKVA